MTAPAINPSPRCDRKDPAQAALNGMGLTPF